MSALFFIAAPAALAEETKTESKIVSPFDVLQVKIPGLDALLKTDEAQVKCTGEGKDKVCEYPWVGIYIKAVYKFLVGISGMLAVIVMMAGGYYWLFSGGNAGRVTQAKEYIGGAVVGLTLALGSYMILNLINPDLLSLKALRIGDIPIIEVEVEGDTDMPVDSGSLFGNAAQLGILASGSLEAIVNSAKGKVTYGLTNKQSDVSRGCKTKGSFITENNKTTICLDCSGFAYYVIKAAYNKTIPEGTSKIFNGQNEIFQGNVTLVRKSDIANALKNPELANSAQEARARYEREITTLKNLPAGALVGWAPGDSSSNGYGHVLVSLGNGKFADSHGGSGRRIGNAIGNLEAEAVYVHRNYLKIYYP